MIMSYFDYGDIFWIKTLQRIIDKIEKLQNRAIGLCLVYHKRYIVDLLNLWLLW